MLDCFIELYGTSPKSLAKYLDATPDFEKLTKLYYKVTPRYDDHYLLLIVLICKVAQLLFENNQEFDTNTVKATKEYIKTIKKQMNEKRFKKDKENIKVNLFRLEVHLEIYKAKFAEQN